MPGRNADLSIFVGSTPLLCFALALDMLVQSEMTCIYYSDKLAVVCVNSKLLCLSLIAFLVAYGTSVGKCLYENGRLPIVFVAFFIIS